MRSESISRYASALSRDVLFGGITDNKYLNDTWVFDGEKWLSLKLSSVPPARYGNVLFYDTKRKSVILFGGVGSNSKILGDTWELKLPDNLSTMDKVATPPPAP
jgi:hypothetical protein